MSTAGPSHRRPRASRALVLLVVAALFAGYAGPGAPKAAAWTDGATTFKFDQPWDFPAQLPATAGAPVTLLVSAVNAAEPWGDSGRLFTDTVHFTSNDPGATLPADYGFHCLVPYTIIDCDDGSHLFTFAFVKAGTVHLTVTDVSDPSVTGSIDITVRPAAAATLQVSGLPATVTTGAATSVKATLRDVWGNVATGYRGTLRVMSSDLAAILPADHTFTGGDGGVAWLQVTFATAGSRTVTVIDTVNGLLNATTPATTVGAASHLNFELNWPDLIFAGYAVGGSFQAMTTANQIDPGYRGTVHFTSTDPLATLPADYTFTVGSGGSDAYVLNDVMFRTAGTQTLTATDVSNSNIKGSVVVNVHGGTVTAIAMTGIPTGTSAGAPLNVQVEVKDAFGNLAQDTKVVHFTSSDTAATLPADFTFHAADFGRHTFSIAVNTSGTRTVTVAVKNYPAITTTATVLVAPGPVAALSVSGLPGSIQAGTAGAITVQAVDAHGNATVDYWGTVRVTSNDPAATLPADYAFLGTDHGAKGLPVTLRTAGTRSVTVTDTVTAGITGTQSGISVLAADSTAPTVSAPSAIPRAGSALSGTSIPLTVYWSGDDNIGGSGIDHFVVERSTDGGSSWSTAVASTTAKSVPVLVPASGTVRFRVVAWDVAGNHRTGSAGILLTPRLIQQTTTAVHWYRTWTTSASTSYSGGSVRYGITAGASASYTFTGRSIAFVTTKATTRGKVKVYVNGVYKATVDLSRSPTQYRSVAWQQTFPTSASRTIKLVVVGTSGRPRVDLDAFVVVK